MAAVALFSVEGLDVDAGGRRLLRGLRFEVQPGGTVGITGPSGCGKTTLLRCLSGLRDPIAGEIRLRGRSGDEVGWPAYRRRVVLVSQQPVLLEGTVEENLRRPFRYASAEARYSESEIRALLEEVDLPAGILAQDARALSVGEQQRVCLVRALSIAPEVLLLDEATSALDEAAAGRVEELLRGWVSDGRGAVWVGHDKAQLARVCDTAVDLADFVAEGAHV